MSDLDILDYEVEDISLETLEPLSPSSRELRSFEIYNRTTLPILVEANLRAIVESQVAPIEERVRAMIIDIVRTCQSTVARNFHLTIAPASLSNDRIRSSLPPIASTETNTTSLPEAIEPAVNDPMTTTDSSQEFFNEPPHFDVGDNASLQGPMSDWDIISPENRTGLVDQVSDSGYASLPHFGGCSCHTCNTMNAPKGGISPDCVPNMQLIRL